MVWNCPNIIIMLDLCFVEDCFLNLFQSLFSLVSNIWCRESIVMHYLACPVRHMNNAETVSWYTFIQNVKNLVVVCAYCNDVHMKLHENVPYLSSSTWLPAVVWDVKFFLLDLFYHLMWQVYAVYSISINKCTEIYYSDLHIFLNSCKRM
jgi:hypothetical protein